MAVGEAALNFKTVRGVRLAATHCGIKRDGSTDLVLLEFAEGSYTAGVFTRSLFAAAPVQICRRHLASAASRYMLINSGNANAGVGKAGLADALATCQALADKTSVPSAAVLPFSTGVIGQRLPVDNIHGGLDTLLSNLRADNWLAAASGIMTTDTRPKIASRQFEIAGKRITLTGIAKGAGMIQPDMATLLSYIVVDAVASQALLKAMLLTSVNQSFNRITVDSDTSTNDAYMLTATACVAVNLDADLQARKIFKAHLNSLSQELAQGIIRDAEGASKFIAVHVKGGKNQQECLKVAYAIANSPLVKTALYASDANWGRIIMAIGKAEVQLDINKLDIFLGDVQVIQDGYKCPAYTEADGTAAVAGEEIKICVNINAGEHKETVWTSDLSPEYVHINAEYRT